MKYLSPFLSLMSSCAQKTFERMLFGYLKVLVVHVADGDGVAAEVHDELTVAQYAHDIAFLSCQYAREYAKAHMLLGEFHEGVAQKGDTLGFFICDFHKWAHLAICNNSWLACAAIVD